MENASKSPMPLTRRLGIIGVGLAILTAAIGLSVNFSNSLGYVELIRTILPLPGLAAAALMGIAFAGVVSRESKQGSTKTGGRSVAVAGFMLLGLGLLWVGNFTNMLLTIVGAAAVGFGLMFWYFNRSGKTPPNWVRYIMILAAFVAGTIPGLVLYVVLSFVVSDRYCQLSSSKCI